jgi:uncharacterized protein DUF3141
MAQASTGAGFVEEDHRRHPLNSKPRGDCLLSVGIELDQPRLRLQFTSSCLTGRRHHAAWSALGCLDIDENRHGAARDLAVEDLCTDILRMPGETLVLRFPHFVSMAGRDADGKPCMIGNCQAGWAMMMLAVLRPEPRAVFDH